MVLYFFFGEALIKTNGESQLLCTEDKLDLFHLLLPSNLFTQGRIGHSMRWNVQYSPYLKDKDMF